MSWARFMATTIPIRHGDFAMQEYIRDIDEAVLQVVSKMLGTPWEDLNNSTKLAEIALPTKFGGMGIQRMCAIAPIAHIGAVTCALPALKKHSKSIVSNLRHSVTQKDQFGIHESYNKAKEHAEWHDHPQSTKAPYPMPHSTSEGLTNPAMNANKISLNLHSRIKQQIEWVMEDRTKSTNKIYRLEAQRDLARFKSAGGDMGATYLELVPKESRFEMKPLLLPSHLFNISMRLRMGMEQQSDKANGGRCRCKEKPRGNKSDFSIMDRRGFHLTACKWGGWCTRRHGGVASEICDWMRAGGFEATTLPLLCKGSLPRYRGK